MRHLDTGLVLGGRNAGRRALAGIQPGNGHGGNGGEVRSEVEGPRAVH